MVDAWIVQPRSAENNVTGNFFKKLCGMINSNEIRVGNRFIRQLPNSRGMDFDPNFVLTEEWMGKLFGDDNSIALQDLFPIPITAEVLEKLGEKKLVMGDTKQYWLINDFLFCEDELVMTRGLHWLQNFIFFKTGTELTYNQ